MHRQHDVSDYLSLPIASGTLKVLVPLDGSESAERSLTMLRAFALLGDVNAFLLSVVDDRDLQFQPDAVEDQKRLRQVYLEQRVRASLDDTLTCDTAVLCGNPVDCIISEADRVNADLVLVSNKKGSSSARWLRGSVADKVVRDCPRNVLVVGRSDVPDRIRSILLPLDGSSLAEAAVLVASSLAGLLGAELHVVRVVPPPPQPLDEDHYGYGIPFDNTRLAAALTEMAEGYVERLGTQINANQINVLQGLPAETLLTYVQQKGIDLVVMTPHGRTGPVRNALGSVTDRMLEGLCSVLVMRTPALMS
jgi:nucleotide-binding universal stress UspA family protein